MGDESENRPQESGGGNPGVDDDVTGREGAGRRAADASPPIGEDAQAEQTTSPTEAGDAGEPTGEEIDRPDE